METHRDAGALVRERQIQIPPDHEGPRGIANGGYLAGLLLRALGGAAVEVTLRRPTPLGRPLTLRAAAPGTVELVDGGELLVSAVRADVDVTAPPPVDFDRALAASEGYLGFRANPHPDCFVCGPRRAPDRGLRIFAGPLEPGTVAAPWIPAPRFADEAGVVAPEMVAAALECPGVWAVASLGERYHVPMLLGRYALRLDAPVRAGEPHVLVSIAHEGEGRTRTSVTGLHDGAGHLRGVARAVWVLPASRAERRGA